MRVGWATPTFSAERSLGVDKHSYGFDGFLVNCLYKVLFCYNHTNFEHLSILCCMYCVCLDIFIPSVCRVVNGTMALLALGNAGRQGTW